MQNTSQAWVATHKETLLPETYIELIYVATEPGLQADAAVSATVEETFSDTDEIVSTLAKSPHKYTTLEWNSWGLDGSFDYFEETLSDFGYVTTTLSDADSTLVEHPTVIVDFSRVHTALIPGVTIVWSEKFDEWAATFRVTVYNGDSVVAQQTVESNTSVTSKVWFGLQNYDRVVVEIISWSHPLHRARIFSLIMGIQTVYTKDDFLGYSHAQTADLLSATLPKNEITFKLRNDDGRWNPGNPVGAEQYLLERQEIVTRYGMMVGENIEWIDGGRFWLSSWSTPSNGLEASFTARDVLEFMNEVYAGTRKGTLYAIAQAVFDQANLPILDSGENRYYISNVLAGYETDFTEVDQEYTLAEVLQLVAHMGGCVMYQNRDGVLCVEPRSNIPWDYEINQNVSYAHPEYEISKPLKSVSVDYGDNLKAVTTVSGSGEVQTVSNALIKTKADADRIGQLTATILGERKTVSGEYRADPRMDVLDKVHVESKYSSSYIVITDITYSTSGGAFRGKYSGKTVV